MHFGSLNEFFSFFILRIIVILLILFCTSNLISAQIEPRVQVDNNLAGVCIWEKTFGGNGDDRAFYSLPVGDNFLVVGSTKSISGVIEGCALMIGSQGVFLWNRTYLAGNGTELRYAANVSDGFLLVGNQFLDGDVNGCVIKVDFAGNIVWKTVVGSLNIDKLFAGAVGASGYAVFGLTYPESNDNNSVGWVVQLDLNGKVVWQKTYGEGLNAAFRSSLFTGDGYVAAGYIDVNGQNSYDFYLAKIAVDGSLMWKRSYDDFGSEKAYSLTLANDGYILVGESHSAKNDADAFVVKVDSDGSPLWSKNVGGVEADSASFVLQSKDNCFLVCGFSFSLGAGQRDFWLFKITDSGEVLWNCALGNQAFQESYSVIDLGNGEYVLVGWADPFGQPEMVGKATYDFWVAKIKLTSQPVPPFGIFFVIGILVFIAIIIGITKRLFLPIKG